MEPRKTSPDQDSAGNKDENFPGYPHYPEKEDILSNASGMHRADADIEEIPRSGKMDPEKLAALKEDDVPSPVSDKPGKISITDPSSDLTQDDLLALGDDNLASDDGDDESLKGLNSPDLAGADLDIPGSELDDASEDLGSEDEENNLYSLGGDNHD